MTRIDPRHGTPQQTLRYTKAGCPCEYCERNRAHVRRRTKLKALGKPARLDAAPVLRHIDRLLASGWNQQNIAKSAGLAVGTLCDLRSGRTKAVTPRTAAAVLALSPREVETPWVPAVGTLRRLQALQALGWPMRDVCRRAGLTPRYGNQLSYTGQRFAAADAARRIAEVYDELSMTPPPVGAIHNHTRAVARRNGAVPPLAWDDDAIDNPDARPYRRTPGPKAGQPETLAATLEDFDWLVNAGESPEKAAARVGVALRTITDYRARQTRREAS